MRLTYVGGPTAVIEMGGLRLLTDPTFDPEPCLPRHNDPRGRGVRQRNRTRPNEVPVQANEERSAGDPIPANCEVIEIHVAELNQLFNAIDPSPFREKDLDPDAEEFIVGWAREAAPDKRLALVVYLDRPAGLPEEASILRDAIREFFDQRAQASRRRLRQLFRRGRTSLVIGVTFLAISVLLGDVIGRVLADTRVGDVLRESLLVGGWVAMWRPMEVFLYDWWPIRAEARLSDRLSAMPVRLVYKTAETSSEAWRWDWPVAAPSMKTASAVKLAEATRTAEH
jgi:hypothetical protein